MQFGSLTTKGLRPPPDAGITLRPGGGLSLCERHLGFHLRTPPGDLEAAVRLHDRNVAV